MLLSEAIREGAKLLPQGFGSKCVRDNKNTSCAMEAAIHVVAGSPEYNSINLLRDGEYGILRRVVACPADGCNLHSDLETAITHLNDIHKWTRERVAGFVATVEAQQTSA